VVVEVFYRKTSLQQIFKDGHTSFLPSTVKTPTTVVRTGNLPICEMEASSPAATSNSASSALRPMMTCSCKWVLIKRRPGDGEIANITNAKKTMLKTMLPEGGGEQTVVTTRSHKWVPIRAARNNLGMNQSEARNITSARKTILKTTLPEGGGGGEQMVVITRFHKWVLIRAANNDLRKSKTVGRRGTN
jgi:hypothetical protein